MVDVEDDEAPRGVFLRAALGQQERERNRVGPAADGEADASGRKNGTVDFHRIAVYCTISPLKQGRNFDILLLIRLEKRA